MLSEEDTKKNRQNDICIYSDLQTDRPIIFVGARATIKFLMKRKISIELRNV